MKLSGNLCPKAKEWRENHSIFQGCCIVAVAEAVQYTKPPGPESNFPRYTSEKDEVRRPESLSEIAELQLRCLLWGEPGRHFY